MREETELLVFAKVHMGPDRLASVTRPADARNVSRRRPVDDNENGQSEAKAKMDQWEESVELDWRAEWDERVGWDWRSEWGKMQYQSSKAIGVSTRPRRS